MKSVKEKEQECWRENLTEMVESMSGSPRGLHGKSVAWVSIQAEPGGHSENREKGSDGVISSVGLGYGRSSRAESISGLQSAGLEWFFRSPVSLIIATVS